MGQKQSSPTGSRIASISEQPEKIPKEYRDSCRLLSDLVKDKNKRHLFASLRGNEAQSIADFMNKALETLNLLEGDDRKNVLHTLSLLAKSAQVFPERLKLRGVEYPDQTHWSSRGKTFKGTLGEGQVGVKVISADIAHEKLFKAHAKEAIFSAHMMHPNILPFYGVCDLSNGGSTRVGIVSEWVDQNLSEYLKKTVDLPKKYLLMSDIISGLAYMHGLDIIHANLQAINVLVSKEDRAFLADFGASRLSIATQTGTESSLGEIYRTSPELFLGEVDSSTPQSDIWAYACTCYEIITGAQPFAEYTGNIPSLTAALTERRAVPTHSELEPGKVDKRILKQINRCWDYEPSKRPTAGGLCKFFKGLRLEDTRLPREGQAKSRITSDKTEIKYDLVLTILQRIKATHDTPNKKAPAKQP